MTHPNDLMPEEICGEECHTHDRQNRREFGALAGSFDGGGLATGQPSSPHLLVPKIKAKYLFCIADNDDQTEPDAKNVLREVFMKVNNPADIEVYKGANHGWCVPTSQVYNHEQAERAWAKLVAPLQNRARLTPSVLCPLLPRKGRGRGGVVSRPRFGASPL